MEDEGIAAVENVCTWYQYGHGGQLTLRVEDKPQLSENIGMVETDEGVYNIFRAYYSNCL